jgi:hypothetical protein
MVAYPRWTSVAPTDPGWYWHRDGLRGAMMLRLDEHGVINSPAEFDDIRAADLVGDWWSARIKACV